MFSIILINILLQLHNFGTNTLPMMVQTFVRFIILYCYVSSIGCVIKWHTFLCLVLYVNLLNLLKADTVKGILSDAGKCLYWYLLQTEGALL